MPGIEKLWLDTFGGVALTGAPVRLEQYVQSLHRWFDVYAFRLGEEQARQVALLFTDTTARKRIESVLAQARADADAGSQAKTDFLLHMSHELRSPLSSILGFTQLIEAGKPPPTPAQRDSVAQILHAGWYLLDLINEILDLSSIESGKMTVVPQAMSINELLDESQAMIAPQAQASGIELGFPHLEFPYRVHADPVIVALLPGVCLVRADDIRSGIEIADATRPDVILMGLHPPALPGVDALLLLAMSPATENIPVIALVTGTVPHDVEASLAAGFFSHLTLPVSGDAFAHALDLAFLPTPVAGQSATATENT